ncbi:MAG: bifunctional UDP-N-acetylmuramoyl-tripeptide:D-alanyl-D-alanine ligase/alanine racemase [Chitinophagales bacterium]
MYNIKQIEQAIVGKWHFENADAHISHLLYDSRKVRNGANTLFFAIKGKLSDGHHFIADLYEKGVRNFVVEHTEELEKLKDVNFVEVKNSLVALQKLAAFHRSHFKIPVLAITGSNGKTIVKEWCHQLLQEDYNICRSPKSYNSQLGVPLSVWGLKKEHNFGIFEAGISEPDEMQQLEKIIQPTIGIFTTISSAHSENFINQFHKIKEKLKLFVRAKTLIYNSDIKPVHSAITEAFGNDTALENTPDLLDWGFNDEAQIKIKLSEERGKRTIYYLTYKKEDYKIKLPFSDTSSIQNAMHGVVLMLHLGYNQKTINKRLKLLQRIEMRLEQKNGINNCIIINDSYNSDIDSLKIAIDFLNQQKNNQNHTVILSDILQSGMSGVDLYTAINDLLVQNKIDRFIGIGKNLMQHKFLFKQEDFKNGLHFYEDTDSFLTKVSDADFNTENVLLKGARKFEFEKISAYLEEKAHATILEIDLNAILHNYKVFAATLKPNVKIMAMVKAFSYGASSVEIAKLLEFNRVGYFGVAYADEGIMLRKAGIKTPIMVLNPEERSFNAIVRYKLEPEIYSFSLLKAFTNAIKNFKLETSYPVHLNIDTGMKRLGFEEQNIEQLINDLKSNKHIKVQSIYSHLVASDEAEKDDFTQQQINTFEKISQQLIKGLGYKPLLHILNSSGISRFKEAQFDMVRLGIGMYGFNAEMQEQLLTVTKLKTKISQVKHLKKGETVGYGRKGIAQKDSTIATIAIGYADGLNRLLSNGVGNVFIQGKKAPIIGNICMDMTMVDVTDIPEAKEGDVAEIFGENISASEIAQQINTIPYEVLCNVSERVKRVFFVGEG